jgi:hypothetical protein
MRYLPLNDEDRADMLARIGVGHVDALFADIPKVKRPEQDLDLPPHKTEMEVERLLSGLAAKNVAADSVPFFVGGAYKHHVPASVDHLIQRSEFLTSYTPYQPEIAQGTLQTIFEFQTQVAALTSMDVANASMYDGSTATVEAVTMARRITKRRKAALSGGLYPHYAEAVRTYSAMRGDTVAGLPPDVFAAENLGGAVDDETSCVVVQSPDFFGNLRDPFGSRRDLPCQGRAVDRGFHRGCLARPRQATGSDGRRYCRWRRAVHRQSLEFRRTLCRALRCQGRIFAPNAGATLRRNRGCLGAARLRFDPFDARTARQLPISAPIPASPALPSRFI